MKQSRKSFIASLLAITGIGSLVGLKGFAKKTETIPSDITRKFLKDIRGNGAMKPLWTRTKRNADGTVSVTRTVKYTCPKDVI